jgi:uncharacterized protein YecE (DUF72 family)
MELRVGCAMWSLPAWQGRFVPRRTPAQERLRAYSTWCTAVEGNTTFYATPTRQTAASWAEQTAPAFRLVAKLPKVVTHERCLRDVDGPLRAYFDALEPLGPRARTLWVQLPAAFGPADVELLESFLRRLPTSHRYAVEVRHPAFFTDPGAAALLESALGGVGAEWVPFDTTAFFARPPGSGAEREAWEKKPRLPSRTAALTDEPIVRYLGRDDPVATVEGWARWVAIAAAWLREGRTPTFMIHTPDNADAPALARQFHDAVRARVPELAPLPRPVQAAPAEAPTLF